MRNDPKETINHKDYCHNSGGSFYLMFAIVPISIHVLVAFLAQKKPLRREVGKLFSYYDYFI